MLQEVPRVHMVTAVAADRPRYSVFGWWLVEGRLYEMADSDEKTDGGREGGNSADGDGKTRAGPAIEVGESGAGVDDTAGARPDAASDAASGSSPAEPGPPGPPGPPAKKSRMA